MASSGLHAERTSSQPQPIATLIVNGLVLTMNESAEVVTHGAVAVSEGRILDIGTTDEMTSRYRPALTIDARGNAVHPGFVDIHTHASLHTQRGPWPEDTGVARYSSHYFAWIGALTPEDEFASTQSACLEMVQTGTTTFIDAGTMFDVDAGVAAIDRVGLRALIGAPWVWDDPNFEWARGITRVKADTASAIARLEDHVARYDDRLGRIRSHVPLFGLGSASDLLLTEAKKLAEETQSVFALHHAFSKSDHDSTEAKVGPDPVLHYGRLGVLGEKTLFSHMNILSASEATAILESNSRIAWNPGNILFLSVLSYTNSRIPELFESGAVIGLGTDTAKAWSYSDQARIGYLLSKGQGTPIGAYDLLWMATVGGAIAAGLDREIGSLEVGKKADIVIRSSGSRDFSAGLHPARDLILTAGWVDAETVMVDGEVIWHHRGSTQVDHDEARRDAESSIKRLVVASGLST